MEFLLDGSGRQHPPGPKSGGASSEGKTAWTFWTVDFQYCFEQAVARTLAALPDLETQTKLRDRALPGGGGGPLHWPAVASVRSRQVRLAWTSGLLRLAASLGLAVLVGCLLDWWFELPRGIRVAALLFDLVLGVSLAWRWLVRPLRSLPTQDALALWIERRHPVLRSRLISAVQLSRGDGDSAVAATFIRRLVDDTHQVAKDLDPKALVPTKELKSCWRWTLPSLGAVLALFVAGWPASWTLLQRACLEEVPVPRKTRLVDVTGARSVGRGDDLVITARVEGLIPSSGRLLVRHPSGRVQKLSFDPDTSSRGRFARLLANIPASFHYRIQLGDAVSDEFGIEVLPRPVVTNLVVTQALPEYTGLSPRQLSGGGFSVLRGSRLRLKGETSQPLAKAELRLLGLDRSEPATLDSTEPKRFEVEFLADDPRITGFAMDLMDQQGIASKDPAVHAVEVVADQPPGVRVLLPSRREELAMARSTVLVSFEATDDYGLAGVTLAYQRAGATNGAMERIQLDLGEASPATVRRRYEWGLSSVKPPFADGTMVEFWIEATDRKVEGGPGVGRSDRYLLRVVTEAEKRADLLSRAGDAIGRLGDVALGQERLNETLGRIILEKPTPR
ncbi:MAG: hypothetical protein IT581_10990 [Verrucomicrobiales bacterium]|nr:hypothetical protein [Verrucomicrobiales bacterium]